MKRLLPILLLLLSAAGLRAGVLKVPAGKTPTIYLTADSVSVEVRVKDQVAITVTRQTFVNRTGVPIDAQYIFPLSLDATVTGFRFRVGGVEHVATISGKPQDTTVLGGGGGGSTDPKLTAYAGGSPFLFPFKEKIAPDSSIVVELTYAQLLKYGYGAVSYAFPFNVSVFELRAIPLRFSCSIETGSKLVELANLTHAFRTTQSDHAATLELEAAPYSADKTIGFTYKLDQQDLKVAFMSHKPGADDGYFIMLASPKLNASADEVIDKIFTFVIDVSGSMAGEKIDQAKEAALYTIRHLNPGDRFNVIAFSSDPRKFRPQPIEATAANVADAEAYVSGLRAEGGTNIEGALMLALGQVMTDTTANLVIFLTDGLAQVDQEKIKQANTRKVRIFVFGIGTDVDTRLLTQLAANNNGLAEFLGTDNVGGRIGTFYDRVRSPLMTSVDLAFSAGRVHEVYPMQLPDLTMGEQVIALGRYGEPGPAVATLGGSVYGKRAEYRYDVEFTADSLVNLFIPKIWAKYKIDALLVLMSGVPQNSNQWKEWRGEIVRLSLLHGILSPFSSFVDPGPQNPPPHVSDVEEPEESVRLEVVCAPNPFTATTTIGFTVPDDRAAGRVTIEIYDLQGRLVATLVRDERAPGRYTIEWSGTADDGSLLEAGAYICRVEIDGVRQAKRIVLIR